MKYGIIATYMDGTQKYCSSARGGHVSLSNDIDDIALFVQESSAVKALKQARKNGAERKNACSLAVVEVQFNVVKTIDVPLPPAKSGFILKRDVYHQMKKKPDYYIGYIKTDRAYVHSGWSEDALESATIFRTDLDALNIISLYVSAIEEDIVEKQLEVDRARSITRLPAHSGNYWYKDPKYLEDELLQLQKMLEVTRQAQVIAV